MGKRTKHRERLRRRMHRRVKPGAAPGTITVDPASPKPDMHMLAFGPQGSVERAIDSPEQVREFLGKWPVVWLNVDGLGDAAALQQLADIFELHPLAMEDVVNVHQRAKVDQYGDIQFVVVHMVSLEEHLDTEQIGMFLGPGFVVTFQERPGWDCLQPVRERIRNPQSRVRQLGADYLLYSLLDAVIDHNFPVLEKYGERLEDLEDDVVAQPRPETFNRIHDIKRELLHLRRIIWPQREALNALVREPIAQITDETRLYLRDCHDHSVRIIDIVETYREMASDLTNLYLSSISNRMNEIMKVLTVIATLFIPLTFIVGVYGMNFRDDLSPWNMPELDWYYGYPLCMGLMAAISIVQLAFFYRKGWIGSSWRGRKDAGTGQTSESGAE
ncbi:MAG: magnesium/cobalt transporter CorA [Pirellulales bacterium]